MRHRRPVANFLRWYRFPRCEFLAGRFSQLYEGLPLRARPIFFKGESTLCDRSLLAPTRHGIRQPRLACLLACYRLIDKVLQENASSDIVGPKESTFELDTFCCGHGLRLCAHKLCRARTHSAPRKVCSLKTTAE